MAKRFSRSHKGFDRGLPPRDDDAREGDDGSGSVQKKNWRLLRSARAPSAELQGEQGGEKQAGITRPN